MLDDKTFVLISNGNVFSMIALADWLRAHGRRLLKLYVTHRLPSSKTNLHGVWSLFWNSGSSYTYYKVWANRLFPLRLRLHGLPDSVAALLKRLGSAASVEPVDSVNSEQVVSEIRGLKPDYLVSFSATQRFKEPLIESPSIAAINVHYGALPQYAGLSPYYWHLHNRERQFGVTLHQIVPALDAGPIIEQRLQPLEGATTCLEVQLRMAACVSPMLNRFFAGETPLDAARKQDLSKKSYFKHPTRQEVAEFHRYGFRMTDAPSRRAALARVEQIAGKAPAKC